MGARDIWEGCIVVLPEVGKGLLEGGVSEVAEGDRSAIRLSRLQREVGNGLYQIPRLLAALVDPGMALQVFSPPKRSRADLAAEWQASLSLVAFLRMAG